MENKRIPTNGYDSNRERFSNFVVDLRKVEKKTVQDLKKEAEAEIKKSTRFIKKEQEIIRKEIGAVKSQAAMIKKRGKNLGLKIGSSFASGSKSLFSFDGLRKLFDIFQDKKRSWRTELKAREVSFRKALRRKAGRLNMKTKAENSDRKISDARTNGVASFIFRYRPVWRFSLILLAIILPFKILSVLDILDIKDLQNQIIRRSEFAVNSLMAAADSVSKMDLKTADADFKEAGVNFLAAQDDLNKINDSILALAAFSGDEKIKLAAESKKFLTAGALASSLGQNLVLATDSLFGGDKDNFSASLDHFLAYGNSAVSDAKSLKKTLAKINPDNLPEAYRAKFESLDRQTELLADNLDNFVATGAKFKEVLGLSRDKRYLLVFQNNAEMRASGGFIGSYALVDIRDGQIRNLEVPGGGSYDTEGGMKVNVVAPQPLWLVNPLWHFWDANWWPDWPTTAKNLMWFYEKSGGPSVDGVISVTPTVMERLLEITGPIDLTAEYGLVIDKDNFWETVQKITEQKNLAQTHPEAVASLPATSTIVKSGLPLKQGLEDNSDNKPKKIIGDLLVKIVEVLPQKLTKENLVKIIGVFEENISEKQALFYFHDPALQAEVSVRNWAGEMRATDKDYLMVVHTNIAGQKSDRLMDEKIDLKSEAGSDGSVVNTLTITRTHNGLKNEALTGVRNVDWLRIYVPAGSELIDASGFTVPDAKYLQEKPGADWDRLPLLEAEMAAETDSATGMKIYGENGKTVFANWLMVDPGQTGSVTVRYRLPFNILTDKVDNSRWKRLNDWMNTGAPQLLPYSLLVQKQPGSRPSAFTGSLYLPDNLGVFWRFPEKLSGDDGWEIITPLDSDKYYSLLLEKGENIGSRSRRAIN